MLSLILSLSFALIILSYAQNERGFDSYIPNAENKYRLTFDIYGESGRNIHDAQSPAPYGPFFTDNTPAIEKYVRFFRSRNVLIVNPGNQSVKSDYWTWSDRGILEYFGMDLLRGNTAFEDLNSVLVSRNTALELFGNIDVVGKNIRYNDTRNFTITGVFEDLPKNSTIRIEVIGALDVLQEIMPWYYENGQNWGGYSFYTYFQLQDEANVEEIQESMRQQYRDRFEIDPNDLPDEYMDFGLIAVGDIHLYSDMGGEMIPPTRVAKIRLLEYLAFIIALIGWINFINIQSARAPERLKEIGIRRSLGAHLLDLRIMFFCEYLIVNLLSLAMSAALAIYVFPGMLLNLMQIELGMVSPSIFVQFLLLSGILFSAFYPAFVVSNQAKASAIISAFRQSLGARIRNVLVSAQFLVSLFLFIFTLVIYTQVRHMNQQDPGFDATQVLVINGPISQSENDLQKAEVFRNQLLSFAGVEHTTFSGLAPGKNNGWEGNLPSRDGENSLFQKVNLCNIFPEFFDVFELDLLAGRIPDGPETDGFPRVILNEAAAKGFNWSSEEAIGKKVGYADDAIVSAVVEDFHIVGFQENVTPMVFIYDHVYFQNTTNDYFLAKVNSGDIVNILDEIEEQYLSLFPNNPFVYTFSNELFEEQYVAEKQFNQLFMTFSVLSILLSITGLIGLTTYHVIQKRKEIGIRKVLGSGEARVLFLFVNRYLKLIGLSSLLAIPFTYWYANRWLADFASRIDLNALLIVGPTLILMLAVLIVVSVIAYKAARLNPVDVLKEEG